ncbi:hypothetical protein FB45DRAFT_825836 [Roridomyces roridus]|uniref:Uncharacterized protein n=1 Tax=Roridomyces roridus TaxID=1738132 RepID=A0AAD7C7S5_9AGAR|nr:hypothetical protein FB45DRAFT_825836 [Roridomyces roridus]
MNLALVASSASKKLKWAAVALVLLNCRSFPLSWTVRVWLSVLKYFVRSWLFKFTLLFRSASRVEIMKRERHTSISRLGRNPFNATTSYASWAGLDDCDYNLHLSNSSYPKILDMARMKAALEHFPMFLRAGGVMVLAGTQFDFIREIPILSRYEIRANIASWDEKRLYLIARFVRLPTKKKVHDRDSKPSLVPQLPLKEPDGAVVHCVSINQFVYKQGPISVPPALALACEGYSNLSPSGKPHTLDDPPPYWSHVKKIGDPKAIRKYMKSWKSVPEEERWWTTAFTGAVEDQRVANMALIEGVAKGVVGARSIVAAY